jgi:class 3 adenylate cyclase/tetratricopeptide (TPR) repeat protein
MKFLKYSLILIFFSINFSYAEYDIKLQLESLSDAEKKELIIQLGKPQKLSFEDSLTHGEQVLILAKLAHDDIRKARALKKIAAAYQFASKNDKALAYFRESLKTFEKIQANEKELAEPLLEICTIYWRKDDYSKALESCLKSLRIYENVGNQKGIAEAKHNTGTVYDLLGKFDTALKYHFEALKIRKKIGDQEGIADSFNAIGIVYAITKKLTKAEKYYLKSLKILEEIDDKQGIAKAFNNVGIIHKELGDFDKALEYYFKSLEVWKKVGKKYEIANVSNNIGQLYTLLKDYDAALSFLKHALKLAKEIDGKQLIQENYEFSSNLYVAQGNYKKALKYYKHSSKIKSQIFNDKSTQQTADMQAKYETEKKEKEIALLKKNSAIERLMRYSLLGGLLLVFVLAFIMFILYRVKKKANQSLSLEKAKSDKLLLNILPVRVANDLKEKGKTEPESFENVTVYFSDIVGFTHLSTQLEPKVLISELSNIFTAFDNIVEKNQCERIKTIGDAYFSVCGMPEENPHHAEKIVQSAIEIIEYLRKRNHTSQFKWKIRIGIHTGKVVGGVVGVKKYIYDVFGDTINTTSRMESNSEPMKINISETTYQIIKDKFTVIERGSIPVKGKGEMKMYFVDV